MGQTYYVVTLGQKMLTQTKVAVRADSEEEAARLALKGVHYDEEWETYEFDAMDTIIHQVEMETQDEAESAFQTHLLDTNETHERIISKWKKVYRRGGDGD